jgi:hypothetical protein
MRCFGSVRGAVNAALLGVSIIVLPLAADAAAPTEIWWGPLNGLAFKPGAHALGTDFMALFAPDAPWTTVRSHLHAFQLDERPFTRRGYSPEELARIVATTRSWQAQGMWLDFVIAAVPVDHPVHREGLMPDTIQLDQRLKQLQRLGIHLDSITMDTPLVNGSINHIMEGGVDQNPGYPVEETARRAARTLSVVRNTYPDIKVYDAEGPQHQPLPLWKQTLQTWLASYQQATGRKLDGMVLDMGWQPGWQTVIRDTCAILHAAGTRCGTILDAPGRKGMTDLEWNQAVLAVAQQISAEGGLGLDFVSFNTWQGHPAFNLPETDPASFTGLILTYIRQDTGSK